MQTVIQTIEEVLEKVTQLKSELLLSGETKMELNDDFEFLEQDFENLALLPLSQPPGYTPSATGTIPINGAGVFPSGVTIHGRVRMLQTTNATNTRLPVSQGGVNVGVVSGNVRAIRAWIPDVVWSPRNSAWILVEFGSSADLRRGWVPAYRTVNI